jgi:hypothetical protein
MFGGVLEFRPLTETAGSFDIEAVMESHAGVEAVLAELWTERARNDELQGEIRAARQGIGVLLAEIGDGAPSAAQAQELGQLRSLIRRFRPSLEMGRARVAQLRTTMDGRRDTLDALLAGADPAVFPTSVEVTCTGDGTGGTAISTPMVLARDGTVQLEVTNEISNEPVFLDVGPGFEAVEVPAAATVISELTDPLPERLEIVCTYATPPDSWSRPAHHLVVEHAP